MQRGVPAGLAADRPRAARIGAPRARRVVAALAVRQPDRVHGREVEHVEAELARTRAAASRRPRSRPTSAGRARTRSRTAARSASTTTSSVPLGDDLLGAVAGRRGEPLLDGQRRHAEQRGALRELARRDRSGPPATLRSSSCCQEATRSTHATTPNCQRPSASTTNDPCQRSRSSGIRRIGSSRQRRAPGARSSAGRRRAPRARRAGSVAQTSTRSPSVRLTG